MRYTILHIYNVVEHIMICCPLAYISSLVTQFYPHYLDQILRFWVTCDDVSMSWLRLTGFSHPYQTYTKCVSTLISLICCPLAYSSSLLKQLLSILVGSDFGVLGHLWSQNDVNTSWSGVFAPPANALGLSIEETDLLFCTLINMWPLPLRSALLSMQSCQCAWPLN